MPRSPLQPWTPFAQWFGGDSEANYHARGNRSFTIDSVGYRFNSLGYRGEEFERRGDDALVLFVGDSITFGIGIPWTQLWTTVVAKQLEDRWGKPVRQCNLAWKGTGPDYAAMIVHQAVEALWPDAVFVLWSYLTRMTWFPDPRQQVHFAPQLAMYADPPDHAAYLRLATESHGFFNYVRNFHLVNARLARYQIPYYWGNLEQLPPELLRSYVPLSGYVGQWKRTEGDLARDGQHPGVGGHAHFAASVMEAIELNDVAPADIASADRAIGPAPQPFARRHTPARPGPVRTAIPRSINAALSELKVRRRIRARQRKDPFIY